jgi:hypothetical protein
MKTDTDKLGIVAVVVGEEEQWLNGPSPWPSARRLSAAPTTVART